jgi:flagellar assembly factor FliW
MKITATRFGDIEYNADDTMTFPDGLIGFEGLHDFVVMPDRKENLLFWIQSIDDKEIAFLLTDPNHFFIDYSVTPDKGEQGKLGVQGAEECLALAIVTVNGDTTVTLNLAAPIVFAPETRRAVQVILEGAPYNTRTPLGA